MLHEALVVAEFAFKDQSSIQSSILFSLFEVTALFGCSRQAQRKNESAHEWEATPTHPLAHGTVYCMGMQPTAQHCYQ